jgi:hypothetical protein
MKYSLAVCALAATTFAASGVVEKAERKIRQDGDSITKPLVNAVRPI